MDFKEIGYEGACEHSGGPSGVVWDGEFHDHLCDY
jgi:hypothetical protein